MTPLLPTARWIRCSVAAVATILLVAGCSSDGGGKVSTFSDDDAPDRAEVIGAVIDDVIVPAYEDVATTTEELADTTASLCATPGAETLDAARASWQQAMSAWQATEAFRFGPAKDLKSNSDIAYEVDLGKLEDDLNTPGELPESIDVTVVGDLGADVRGLAAIEQILFSADDSAATDPRRCAFAAAASQLVADGAVELRDAWTVGVDGDEPFAEQMRSPGGDSMYADETEVLADLVNGSIAALTTVADMYLGPASGADGAEPAPASVDPGAAHRAGTDVVEMLDSVRSIYGERPDEDSPTDTGLGALVAAQSLSTDARMSGDLADAAEALAAVTTPYADLVVGDEAQAAQFDALTEAYDNVVAARVTLRTEIASQLGVTVSFSDSDGDG